MPLDSRHRLVCDACSEEVPLQPGQVGKSVRETVLPAGWALLEVAGEALPEVVGPTCLAAMRAAVGRKP